MKLRPYQVILAAALLLVPCVWQTRIYAGDLSSHIYNAWLATLIEKGQAPGLVLHPMVTNVFFDILLETLFKRLGADWAQKLAASLAVLVFAFGMLAYLRTVGGKRAWFLFPVVAMLSYGYIFHMGFFNFLLALGVSLAALSLLVRGRPLSIAAGWVLLALAFWIHFMPPLWAICMAAYYWLHRSLKPRYSLALLAVSIGLTAALRFFVAWRYSSTFSSVQSGSLSGADQFWVFGGWTLVFVPLMLLVWGLLFLRLAHVKSPLRIVLGFPAQSLILNSAAVLILPRMITPPGYQLGFNFITERLSLMVAITVCALVAASRPRFVDLALMAAVCCGFFAAMYAEDRRLGVLEDRLTSIVETLPAMARVVTPLNEPARANQWNHLIDRVCLGRCFSYTNYEPTTGHFRIRIQGSSPVVAPDFAASAALEWGLYQPPPGTPDYFQIEFCEAGGPQAPRSEDPLCVRHVRPSGSVQGNAEDQTQVPGHQSGVPVVDPADQVQPASAHANGAQPQRNPF